MVLGVLVWHADREIRLVALEAPFSNPPPKKNHLRGLKGLPPQIQFFTTVQILKICEND